MAWYSSRGPGLSRVSGSLGLSLALAVALSSHERAALAVITEPSPELITRFPTSECVNTSGFERTPRRLLSELMVLPPNVKAEDDERCLG